MSEPVHVFLPIVSARKRDDGRYEVTFDWGSSYSDDSSTATDSREAWEVCEAINEWVSGQPEKFIIPAAEVFRP